MKKFILYPLRGVITILILALSTIIASLCVYFFGALSWLVPFTSWRKKYFSFLYHIPMFWIAMQYPIRLMTAKKWDIQNDGELSMDKPYMLISNHVSWLDILTLSYTFHRKCPPIKFFAKKQLLWTLPFAGLAMRILGYPLLERGGSKKLSRSEARIRDMEITHKACQSFIKYPTTIINYLEGTRFSEKKRDRSKSPYQHLLTPKAGALAIVMQEMTEHLGGVIDATVAYEPSTITFWQFCCGNFDKIICHYRVLPVDEAMKGDYTKDREFRKQFQSELNTLWQEKDKLLQSIKSPS